MIYYKQSNNTVIDVNATKLFYDPTVKPAPDSDYLDGDFYFAMRITNIPVAYKSTMIYARPYYVFEYNGKQITVYGETVFESYEPQKDVNDGWLEWD